MAVFHTVGASLGLILLLACASIVRSQDAASPLTDVANAPSQAEGSSAHDQSPAPSPSVRTPTASTILFWELCTHMSSIPNLHYCLAFRMQEYQTWLSIIGCLVHDGEAASFLCLLHPQNLRYYT